MVEYIGGHGEDAEPCCVCCEDCYCKCCSCPVEGSLDFDMVECFYTKVGVPSTQYDCDCDDWSFTMTQAPDMCYVHTSGGGCSPCDGEYQGSAFGPGGTLPYDPNYTEAWGWSGVICDDCTNESPPADQSSCGGMTIKASLCCCKTGIYSSAPGHPCPLDTPPSCQATPPTVYPGGTLCALDCFWFEITPWWTYYINGGAVPDSPCSRCAAFPAGGGGGGGLIPGSLQDRICMVPISGQCGCNTCSPTKKFMLLVSGTFTINCDCQTGVYQSFGGGGGSVTHVMMTLVGLISES